MQNCPLKAGDTIIHDQVFGSDHCPIELMLYIQNVMPPVMTSKLNLEKVKNVVANDLSDELSRGLQLEDSTPMKMMVKKARKSKTPQKF